MTRLLAVAFALALAVPPFAFSSLTAPAVADDGPPVDCANISGSTYEINICSERDFEAADEKLNAVWKRVLAGIAESDGESPWDAKSWEKKVREAQRAWVAFRDADCKDAVPMEWTGGTGTTAAVLGCMTEKTNVRTKELSERFGIE